MSASSRAVLTMDDGAAESQHRCRCVVECARGAVPVRQLWDAWLLQAKLGRLPARWLWALGILLVMINSDIDNHAMSCDHCQCPSGPWHEVPLRSANSRRACSLGWLKPSSALLRRFSESRSGTCNGRSLPTAQSRSDALDPRSRRRRVHEWRSAGGEAEEDLPVNFLTLRRG